MKKIFTRLFVMLSWLLVTQMALAQTMQIVPATTPPFTPVNLIENVFLGDGVEVLNITYTGDNAAVGYFKLGTQDIGIYEGIVMSTGFVSSIPVSNNTSGGTTGNTTGGADPDLTVIAANPTFDAAIYTIDFIPSADTLQFKYVFGSEEYPTFVCTPFNDAFGFFLSGPGITGPYQNMAQNIALIPNSNTPVSISTVNAGGTTCPANSQYFVNNPTAAGGQSTYQIDYDGFTTVLTATAVVTPCQTYRIKLAIADGSDFQLDSGVFLEGYSFGTNGLKVYSQTPSLTNSIAEGCQPATINFELENPADAPYNLSYSLGGSAEYGIDYTSIPLNAVIPTGQSSFQLPIHALPDNITEGIDTIELYINVTPCEQDTFLIFIEDAVIVPPVALPGDSSICIGDTVAYDATITSVPLPLGAKYVNDTIKVITDVVPTSSYIDVNGLPMFNVQAGTIDSVCIDANHIWMDDMDVYLIAPDGKFLELTTDNGGFNPPGYVSTCFTPTATTPITAGAPPYTGAFLPEEPFSKLYGSPVNGKWQLRIIDDNPFLDGTLLRWSISFAKPYDIEYAWSGDTSVMSCIDCPTPNIYPDTTTTFIVTAFDSYGCETYDTVTITVEDSLPPPIAICDSITTNLIQITWPPVVNASGYLVTVDGGATIPVTDTFYTATGLSPDQTVEFTIVANDGFCPPNGIDTVTCTTLSCSLVGTVIDSTDASCFGYSDGSAIVTAINGYGNYYYSLNGGTAQINNGAFTNLSAGTYQVIVTDDDSCADTLSFTINQPTGMSLTPSSTATSCNGGNDGTATIAVTGGTPPYAYQWSTTPSQIIPTATGLSSAMYYVTVTDGNSCSQVDSIFVPEPALVTATTSTTIVSCNGGNDGTATVTPNGGTGTGYTYNWSTTPTQTAATATGLSIGTYYVTISDANNCTTTDSATITEQPIITLSSTSTAVSCSGGTDGTATVTASGGVGGFTYAWSTTPVQTTTTATNLTAGTFYVTVTDLNNCPAIDTITVGTINPIIITTSHTPASCIGVDNGTGTVNATGGAGGFTYAWSTTPVQTTTTATNLGYGAYTVTVTDANGCSDTSSVFINTTVVLVSVKDSTAVSCFGGNDGTATISVTGGLAPYTYNWNLAGAPNASMLTNLIAGTYTVTTTDGNGCFRIDSMIVEQPAQVITTTSTIAVSCNNGSDGSTAVAVTGGAMPYAFAWSTTPVQNTNTATSLSAGKYYVTVTDANNCSYLDSATITEPTPIILTTSMNPVSCFGGNNGGASVNITGGTAPYTASWNTSPITSDTLITNVPAGTYTVTVLDANNCQATATITVTEPSTAVSSTISGTDVNCNNGNDGTATVIATGGTGTYTYLWSNNQNTATATGLTATSHSVTVTDQNGCTTTNFIVLNEPSAISLVLNQRASGCFNSSDGIAFVTATGGTPDSLGNYNYAWNTLPFQTSDTATGLVGGQTYTVLVTDANGCTANESITITQPTPVVVSDDTIINILCFGDTNGSASVNVTGGSPSYTYLWDANANNQTTATATNLGIGSYTVTVTDASGCNATHTISIIQPSEMTTTTNSFEVACKGESTGTATVQVAGGTPSYTYLWDANANNQTTIVASNLAAGQYLISVTDASGCTVTDSVEVIEPTDSLSTTVLTSDVTCFDDTDGSIRILATGGTPNYEFSFDSLTFTPSNIVAGLGIGNYDLFVKDDRGCQYKTGFAINGPLEMTVELGADIIINYGEDTTLIPIITNGVMPYQFSWSPPDSLTCIDCEQTQTQNIQLPTRYYLTVTDADGCTAIDDIWIGVLTPRIVYVATGFTPNNDGTNETLFVQGDFNAAKVVKFNVYDRWGENVFEVRDVEVNDPTSGWDGTFKNERMQTGVYGWVAEIEFTDGKRIIYKGNTTLIR
ncbi:MAG: choice-of-anchor L domain-containing protein [Saprospiraceae bacterium]